MKHDQLVSAPASRPTAQSHSFVRATVVLWTAFLLCKSVALGAASDPAVEGDAWWRYVQVDLAEQVDAGAVFVGYGLVIPEMGIDDLAGLDLKGKIAVILTGGAPKSVPAPVQAHYSAIKQRWGALRQHGAVGTASFQNPKSADIPWARSSLARLQPAMTLADPSLNDSPGLQVTIRLNPAHLDQPLDKAAAGKFSQLVVRLLQKVGNDPSRPAWKEQSFFRRFAQGTTDSGAVYKNEPARRSGEL